MLTAKGYRVAPPELASQLQQQATQGPSGPCIGWARRVMRQQGWRDGQALGVLGQTGLRRPVDAFADLGGRPSTNRSGMGFY